MSANDNLWEALATKLNGLAKAADVLNLADIPAFVDAALHSDSLDDRELLLERALVVMAKLGNGDATPRMKKIGHDIEKIAINLLYTDLPHPPADYSAVVDSNADVFKRPQTQYAFRSVDGTGYNPLIPGLGRAGGPYARSVPGLSRNPPTYLPDAALVFDTLLSREEFVPHPGGISSLFFAFADIIIHTLFETDHRDWNINKTSSYLDLSVLYGTSQESMQKVRRYDGTGRLWNDVWADQRLLLMPPSVCALMIIFNRNHNFIADKLLSINENGTYDATLENKSESELKAQDEDIFNRARLVNCGFFMQVILGDYVGSILGLVRDGYDWRLDPLMEIRKTNHDVVPRGEGNVVAIEFNLLYRWHAALSEEDTAWTRNLFKTKFDELYPGQNMDKMTIEQFQTLARASLAAVPDVKEWTFSGLRRNSEGSFNDDDIAKILQDATIARAGAFKARGIPTALRVIEIMGIEQSRAWGACSLNEFRRFIGLKPYETFKEWNPDVSVANAAQALYKDIENLELHVGMQAEQSKEPGPGAGLCPGYTISRTILADAVALTRGDRFLTSDLTPMNLTTWGYKDCQRDTTDGAYGGMLTRLLFRHLPAHYPSGSALAHFPFLTPDYLQKEMKPAQAKEYIWSRPELNYVAQQMKVVNDYEDVKQVLESNHLFISSYRERLAEISQGRLPLRDTVARVLQEPLVLNREAQRIENMTNEAIRKHSFTAGKETTKYVDIVLNVLHEVPVKWVCEIIAGLPQDNDLQTSDYIKKFGDIFRFVSLSSTEPGDAWSLRASSRDTYQLFTRNVKRHLEHLNSWASSVTDQIAATNTKSHAFLAELKGASASTASNDSDLATALFCEVAPTVTPFAVAVAVCVDYYLNPAKEQQRKDIVRLSKAGKGEQVWKDFMLEALGSSPPISSKEFLAMDNVPGIQPSVGVGDIVVVGVLAANGTRKDAAALSGLDAAGLTTPEFLKNVGSKMLATILDLPGLQPVSKSDQVLSTRFVNVNKLGVAEVKYQDRKGSVIPWPTEAILKYEPRI